MGDLVTFKEILKRYEAGAVGKWAGVAMPRQDLPRSELAALRKPGHGSPQLMGAVGNNSPLSRESLFPEPLINGPANIAGQK